MAQRSHFTVLYDANVLYSAPLRDLLMRLALTDLFRAKWTEAIHDEWSRNLLADRSDISTEQIERIRTLMNTHVRDALVEGYEQLIPSIDGLPDPDDRHVLAAAIVGRANTIITRNLKDFPVSILAKYGIEAQHPDDFVRHLLDLDEAAVCGALRKQRMALTKPLISVDTLLDTLEAQGLPQSVAILRTLHTFL